MNARKAMTDAHIDDFWVWFSESCEALEALVAKENARAIRDLVESRVHALDADLGWEVGPAGPETLFFAFALNGLQENIAKAQRIVDAAPKIEGWVLRVGKPPKEWQGCFFMMNDLAQEIEIDISSWKYVLTGYDDSKYFDIRFLAHSLPSMNESARCQMATLVVQSLIGELNALTFIESADVVSPPPSDLAERATPLQFLADHLVSLIRDADRSNQ